mmetsp:Transcript_7858/g.13825  ORF Transcript_7858/g.13825 Transcript_7858/m.13825 type:complete len:126 (+) Transcript_7858:695-1072(+)
MSIKDGLMAHIATMPEFGCIVPDRWVTAPSTSTQLTPNREGISGEIRSVAAILSCTSQTDVLTYSATKESCRGRTKEIGYGDGNDAARGTDRHQGFSRIATVGDQGSGDGWTMEVDPRVSNRLEG